MNYNFLINPLYKLFAKTRTKDDLEKEEQSLKNSVSTSENEFISRSKNQFVNSGEITTQFVNFDQLFNSKHDKILKLRLMEDFPEISDALDTVSDESIVKNADGNILSLVIKDEEDLPSNIVKQVREESDYLLEEVFNVKERAWPLMKRFLVEGEIYLEKILNDKKDSIIGLKVIPPFKITPFYQSNVIKGFIHGTIEKERSIVEGDVNLNPQQVAYINWGEYINGDITDPKSYLYSSMKTYNQLKNLEDSLIVYRLTRSIEKRVFNIETGQMPTGKAREFINKLINTYKKNTLYDPGTGTIQSSQHLMSLNEDFWFTQQDGKGSKVETLQSGMNLGELKDIDYFLKKLYKTLKMPRSRWEDGNSLFGSGKGGEITREEIKFDNFIDRIHSRFKKLFLDCLLTQLKLKGIDEKYINVRLYDYQFSKANYFADYKEMELIETKFGILNNIFPLIWSPSNPNGIFDQEFILKKYFKMSEEDYLENQELLDAKRDDAMDDHLETQEDLTSIKFGVADMAKEKKEKEKEADGKGGNLKGKPFKKSKKAKSDE